VSRKKAIAWVIATILMPLSLMMFLANGYLVLWYMRTGYHGPPPPHVIVTAVLTMTAPGLWLTIGLWWLFHRKTTRFTDLFAVRSGSPGTDLMIGTALGAAWVAVYGLAGVVSFDMMFLLDAGKWQSLPTSVSAGICEELLFRGFVLLVIARAGCGRAAQLVLSSLAFGLAHVFWGPWGMLWTLVLGLTFGAVRVWRDSVWPAVAAHTLLNVCIEPGLFQAFINSGFQN